MNLAVIGNEAVGRILGGDAALQRITVQRNFVLRRERDFRTVEREPLRYLNLAADDVDAGDDFGDGVLDLHARVDFDEEPLAGVGVHQKLDRSGVVITGGARQGHGGIAEGTAGFGFDAEGGRDLDHLLMAALHGAIALVQMEDVAVAVAENLHLDVLGALDVALEEHGVVAESGRGFAASLLDAGHQVGGRFDDAHAAPAAAEHRLDDQGKTDAGGDFGNQRGIGDGFFGAGHDGHSGALGELARGGFIAELFEQVGRGTDEDDSVALAGARQGGVLAQKAVARMNGVDAFLAGERDDVVDIEVGLHRAFALADEVSFVGFEAVEAEAVLL